MNHLTYHTRSRIKALMTLCVMAWAMTVFAQVPNGSFEDWDTTASGLYYPKHWRANFDYSANHQATIDVTTTTASGDYAVQLMDIGHEWGEIAPAEIWCWIESGKVQSDTLYVNLDLTGYTDLNGSSKFWPYVITSNINTGTFYNLVGVNTVGYQTFSLPLPAAVKDPRVDLLKIGFMNAVAWGESVTALIDSVTFTYQSYPSELSEPVLNMVDQYISHDGCSIHISDGFVGHIQELKLYGLDGKLLQSLDPHVQSHQLGSMNNGLYILECRTNHLTMRIKILKQCT